jgi:hypothetical protein
MKFTAIHLPVIWLVLQALPSLVLGGSLRGLSSSLSVESKATTPPPPAVLPEAISPLHGGEGCPEQGKAQIWLGFHSINTNLDQAKIWVISPYKKHRKAITDVTWNEMIKENIPPAALEPGVRKGCYYFFSVGAGVEESTDGTEVLVARINHEDDLNNLDHPVFLKQRTTNNLKSFMTSINHAIETINENFAQTNPSDPTKTILKYNPLPHTDWYRLGHGWGEFNANGIISGLVNNYLKYNKNIEIPSDAFAEGWDRSVPEVFFSETFSTVELPVEAMKAAVYENQVCEGGPAELFVGYHTIDSDEQDVSLDHAKIWVVRSTDDPLLDDRWMDLSPERVPYDYAGDMNCAKFLTLGSGFDSEEIIGVVNYEDDYVNDLLGAQKAASGFDPDDLLKIIDESNEMIKQNFENTSLKRTTAFPQFWNKWGFEWNEFNGNGFISGFLNYYLKELGDDGREVGTIFYKPFGAFLDGWEKDIPIEFFTAVYSEEGVKDVIDGDHTPEYGVVPELEETQQSSLDP